MYFWNKGFPVYQWVNPITWVYFWNKNGFPVYQRAVFRILAYLFFVVLKWPWYWWSLEIWSQQYTPSLYIEINVDPNFLFEWLESLKTNNSCFVLVWYSSDCSKALQPRTNRKQNLACLFYSEVPPILSRWSLVLASTFFVPGTRKNFNT